VSELTNRLASKLVGILFPEIPFDQRNVDFEAGIEEEDNDLCTDEEEEDEI